MGSPGSIENATLLARASTADVYAWGAGHVLKLFFARTPWHASEVAATRAAHEAGLPIPRVIDGLIEVSEREGIAFERIDGPTMTESVKDHPDRVGYCAQQAAELHAWLHSTEVPEHLQRMWQRFWDIYFHRYGELRPSNSEDLFQWRIVAAAASLVWGPPVASIDQRVSFVKTALGGTEHPWLSG
jgi:hypothetical protein